MHNCDFTKPTTTSIPNIQSNLTLKENMADKFLYLFAKTHTILSNLTPILLGLSLVGTLFWKTLHIIHKEEGNSLTLHNHHISNRLLLLYLFAKFCRQNSPYMNEIRDVSKFIYLPFQILVVWLVSWFPITRIPTLRYPFSIGMTSSKYCFPNNQPYKG